MRRSLLNKQILSKSLRQVLVLITMLLLPSAAWGGDPIISIFTGYDATTSTITFGNGSTGEWSLYGETTGVLSTYNTNQGLQITNSEGSYQSSFKLISNFTVSGTIALNATLCTINMGHSDSSNPTGSISIKYDPSGVQYTQEVSNLQNSLTTGNNTFKITNMPMGGNEQAVTFENNHLIIEFNNLNPGNGAFYISSIELSSELTKAITNYDLWIGGTQVNSENASNVLGDDLSGGKEPSVKFTPASSDNNNINTLTLNDASITGNIISELENLTINLSEQNSISGSISTPNQATSSDRSLSFTGNGSLSIESGAISGFKSVNTDAGLYIESDNPNLSSASNVTISSNETYPIWVYNTSTTKYTQLTANASSYTTAEANVDENHKGSVFYSANTNTLTLDNFFCKTTEDYNFVFYIGESLNSLTNSLTVDLVGTNEIYYNCFYYLKPTTSDGDLQLTYTTSSNGSLQFTSTPYYTNVDCVYDKDKGLGYDPYESTISTHWPRLEIGSTKVTGTTGEVTSGEGYYMYDDNTKTLTLSGATIGDVSSTNTDISVYLDDLTVEISGTNTIYGRFWGQYSENGSFAGKINFKNADFANASLLIHASPGLVYEFTDCQLSKDIKITEAKYNQASVDVNAVTYENGNFVYGSQKNVLTEITLSYQTPITVAGASPDSEGKFNGIDNVTFTPATQSSDGGQTPGTPATLTLSGATINGVIEWNSNDDLVIALNGENSITNDDGNTIEYTGSNSSVPTLTFAKAEGATNCELTLTHGEGSTFTFISNLGYADPDNYSYITAGSGLYYIGGETTATITSTLLGGGSGTSADPFLIKNLNDLKNFAKYVNEGILTSEFVQLKNTINCSEIDNFEPIGNYDYQFIGTFDGNNMTISELNTEGLFGIVEGGTIMNLKLDNCTFTSTSTIGGIASVLYAGTIQNCSVTNTKITSNQQSPRAGGIVGEMYSGLVKGCKISGSETEVIGLIDDGSNNGSTTVGGIVAYANPSDKTIVITECEVSSVGNIMSNHNIPMDYINTGGIVGRVLGPSSSEGSISISKNAVKGSTIITSENNLSTSDTEAIAGAIIGSLGGDDVTLTENTYESSVTTKTKSKGATNYTTKSGNTQRGIGDSDDIIENSGAMLAGTKSITIGCFVHESNEASSYYYSSFDEENEISTVLDLPENNTVICLSLSDLVEAEGSTAKFTITNASTNKEIDATIEDVKEDNVYSYTKISFTMPDADVTIAMDIFAIPVSLSELGFVDENQTSSTYFSTEKNWNVPEGIVAYVITGISGSNVITSRVSSIPKGVPVFLEKGSSTEEPKDNSNNILYGTVEATDVTSISGGTVYVLYNNMFVKSTSGTIPAHRCYLLIGNSVATTRGFGIDHGDGTSGIREVKSGEVKGEKLASGEWFDLQGRRLNAKPNKSGLYILNGRKVVIK